MTNNNWRINRDRGYLPHWESKGASYAVTFRLADSIPIEILTSYIQERNLIIETAKQMNRDLSPREKQMLEELHSERIENYLDQGAGECLMQNPAIGKIVFDAISHFNGDRYDLTTWCVMPNHVHV